MKQPLSDEQLTALLRLKRHEKPDASFWVTFDSELKEKAFSHLLQHRETRLAFWLKLMWQRLRPVMPATASLAVLFIVISHLQGTPAALATEAQADLSTLVHSLDVGKISSLARDSRLVACQSIRPLTQGIDFSAGSIVTVAEKASLSTRF
ncbi:MAG: hypothetical protein A2Y14_03170 [Verrucomicrobia bacterium GWF2_51_19]|nr:MAG: hypothetical protein A2Y14_03170 [Verrucomicrobia bacterium GWF2_51_19]HCJ12366.1 hypothetical protein [Opitutae bacterium]